MNRKHNQKHQKCLSYTVYITEYNKRRKKKVKEERRNYSFFPFSLITIMLNKTIQVEKCWCGEHHIDKCEIHGSQPFYHDEGDGWNIYRCVKCERVQDSFAYGEHVPYDNYWVTLPIRAMVVLADALIQDSVNGSGEQSLILHQWHYQ
tara:strand:+ start:23320 stop:23763 length:444 start_codon:yes stop_codon:yes gene_type:complete